MTASWRDFGTVVFFPETDVDLEST